jgi:hypothetical protein
MNSPLIGLQQTSKEFHEIIKIATEKKYGQESHGTKKFQIGLLGVAIDSQFQIQRRSSQFSNLSNQRELAFSQNSQNFSL